MARINLLPWREAERKRHQQEFAVAAGVSFGVALLLALVVHLQIEGLIETQQGRNRFLQNEIAALDAKIKKIKEIETTKAGLIARMNIIQQLQESRPAVVHLFDELVVTIPDGVYLTRAEQSGKSVIVDGQAQSNARVSALMRNIEASPWISSPSLQLIENKDQTGTGLSRFRLRFDQRYGFAVEEAAPPGARGKPAGGQNKPAGATPAKPKATPAPPKTPQKPT